MRTTRFLPLAALLLTTAACEASTSPSGKSVGLSFSGVRPSGVAAGFRAAPAGPNAMGDSLSITDGTNTLIFTKVEVVAREIELRRAGVVSCDSTLSSDTCEYFSAFARLVTLPLTELATQVLQVDVAAGTYSSIRMKIHKVSDDVGDAAFLTANPTWPAGQSIRVTGFYNGVAFTYLTDVNFEAEETLSPPLVVDGTTPTNLTVRIDLSTWFRNGATGPLIDPATAGNGGGNKSTVENNIKNSVKAFEDKDQDGDERDG